jgi:hypothetical protein
VWSRFFPKNLKNVKDFGAMSVQSPTTLSGQSEHPVATPRKIGHLIDGNSLNNMGRTD